MAARQARARPQPQTFKKHVSMTSVRRNVLDFETALQSSPELAALAGGNSHSPSVSVSHPPPSRALSLLEEEPWEKGATRRARVSMAAAHSGRSWFLSRILFLRCSAP